MIPRQTTLDSKRAYNKLVELLLSGAISEDVALSERGLSMALGLGRTPIREAVKDLVREGVLESHPTRGTILRPLSVADLRHLYEVRYAIEGLAAYLAADRGPIEELRPYADAFEETLRAPERQEVGRVHDDGVEFHFEVIRIAGNPRLLEIYRPFRLRFRIPFGIVRHNNPERVMASVVEHREILSAIMERDSERARRLMCDHLRKGLDFRMEMLVKGSRVAMPPVEGAPQKTAADADPSLAS